MKNCEDMVGGVAWWCDGVMWDGMTMDDNGEGGRGDHNNDAAGKGGQGVVGGGKRRRQVKTVEGAGGE